MANSNWLLFSSGSGSASQEFVQQSFQDWTLPATNNTGFSSSPLNNPSNLNLINDDKPRYGVQTLYIKNIVEEKDQTKWINGKKTSQIIWDKQTAVYGYILGNVFLNDLNWQMDFDNNLGSATEMGIIGVCRKVEWIIVHCAGGTGTANFLVDGVSTGTETIENTFVSPSFTMERYLNHSASLQTKALHDYRLNYTVSSSSLLFRVVGVRIYFENATNDIDIFPGTTFVDKNQITTTGFTNLPLPSMSYLGGNIGIYKNSGGSYGADTISASYVTSTAIGSSGANTVTVNAGTGQLFTSQDVVVIRNGSSSYCGKVTNVSTDVLTVSPTLGLGLSNTVYRAMTIGPSLSIGSTLYANKFSFDFQYDHAGKIGYTACVKNDPYGRYRILYSNMRLISSKTGSPGNGMRFENASTGCFAQIDANCVAADLSVYVSQAGMLDLAVNVNGFTGFNYQRNVSYPGFYNFTLFKDAAVGWKSIKIFPGPSTSTALPSLKSMNVYEYALPNSASQTYLANIQLQGEEVFRTASNQSLIPFGLYRREFVDRLTTYNPSSNAYANIWTKYDNNLAGGVGYYFGLSAALGGSTRVRYDYYGSDVAFIGSGTTYSIEVDGAASAFTFGQRISLAQGFHRIDLVHLGQTTIVSAVDSFRSSAEINYLTHSGPISSSPVIKRQIGTFAAGISNFLNLSTMIASPWKFNGNVKIIDIGIFAPAVGLTSIIGSIDFNPNYNTQIPPSVSGGDNMQYPYAAIFSSPEALNTPVYAYNGFRGLIPVIMSKGCAAVPVLGLPGYGVIPAGVTGSTGNLYNIGIELKYEELE